MGDFDRTLKYIMRRSNRVTRAFGYEGTPVEIPSNQPVVKAVRERFIDGLFLMEGAEQELLHVEHQASTDDTMAERMLSYLADLRYWRTKIPSLRGLKIVQVVVYVGDEPWDDPPTSIDEENLKFRYRLIHTKTIDPAPLLKSDNIADVVYAVLCRGGTEVSVLREVLKRIGEEPDSERAEILVAFMQLCGFRRIDRLAMSEIKKMGIEFNFADTETGQEIVRETTERVARETTERVARETTERVARDTLIEAIITVMRARFPTDLPVDLRGRLEAHTHEELRDITERVGAATSAEEALDVSPGIAPR